MKKVIILLGPTGVGKTGVSVLLATELKTEIISADSMQIYRGMDIGTAKPSSYERAAVVHHMIDVVEPTESFSAGSYAEAVAPLIEKLHKGRKIPVIVGGTGLYIKCMTRGIFGGPSADWDLRNELLSVECQSPGSLHAYLAYRDPASAAKIEKNDTRRLVRAIEVSIKQNEEMSSVQRRLTTPMPYEFIKIGLTRERKELYRLIDRRVEVMVGAGLIDEVGRLLGRFPGKTPLQAIGYKEFIAYFNGEIGRDEAISLVKRNSRRYAKRQFTWFRKEEDVSWIDITGIYDSTTIFDRIKGHLERAHPSIFEEVGLCEGLRIPNT